MRASSWRLAFGTILMLRVLTASPGQAQAPPICADYPGFRTGVLHFVPPGSIVAMLGAEYLPEVTNPVAGVTGDLLRLPTIAVRLGLAPNAEFQISWPVYNRLRVTSQQEPAVFNERFGDVTSDAGDITIATLIQVAGEGGTWPGFGVKVALKLPNSDERKGIGDNATDVFASGLLSKSVGSRVTLYGDIGFGVLTEPTRTFAQNDVLTYGLLGDYWAGGRVHVVAELVGRKALQEGGPGTETRSQIQVGVELGPGTFTWNVLLVRGLTRNDSRSLGIALNIACRIGVLKPRQAQPRASP